MMQRPKRKKSRWLYWGLGVLASVILALALIPIDDVVIAQGIVEPGQKVYIDSPLRRVLSEVLAPQGTRVKAGQAVAQLYDGDLRANVAASKNEIMRAEASLEFTEAQLSRLREQPTPEELNISESRVRQAEITIDARKQELERAKYLYSGARLWSKEDLEGAQTSYDLAQANLQVAVQELSLVRRGASTAELRQAIAEVNRAETEVEKARSTLEADREALNLATLRSPVDGTVARLDLHPGMLADQGQIVMIVAGSGEGTIIDSWVHETNAWKIRMGQPVEILSNLFADREDYAGLGEISKIYGYAVHDGGGRTFELNIDVKETPLPLKYGTTADLRIIVGERSVLSTLLGIENQLLLQASVREAGDWVGSQQMDEPESEPAHPEAPPGESVPDSAASDKPTATSDDGLKMSEEAAVRTGS